MDWLEVLRQAKKELESSENDISPHLEALSESLSRYAQGLCTFAEKQRAALVVEEDEERRHGDDLVDAQETKNTRNALRLLLFVSAPTTTTTTTEMGGSRTLVQTTAVCQWKIHHVLSRIASAVHHGDAAAEKIRTLACRSLCNLVTTNATTAAVVLRDLKTTPQFVDMIAACASCGNRDALAAVAATLHNALSSLPTMETEKEPTAPHAAASLSQDRLLMSNLLRHILPNPRSIVHHHQGDGDPDCSSPDDSATEWISRLMVKLSSLGAFRDIYESLGSRRNGEKGALADAESFRLVTPEHVIFLHCILRAVEQQDAHHDNGIPGPLHTLGGGFGSMYQVQTTLAFLAAAEEALYHAAMASNFDERGDEKDSVCPYAAYVSILEILATATAHAEAAEGEEDPRAFLEHLVTRLVVRLSRLVDEVMEANANRKARDLSMTSPQRQVVILYVCLLGNLVFGCRENQNVLRTTLVPVAAAAAPLSQTQPEEGVAAAADNRGNADSSEKDPSCNSKSDREASFPPPPQQERCGLHVLLSCTLFAPCCPTLREWCVVAIRNALHDNAENQRVVEELEAQAPLSDTAELRRMGVSVQMDPRGRVKVVPRAPE